ncbi:MAG: WYL domain-containing protein [Acidimicrobiales bacterium]|nr:WYL domain-containing protein [Acidimicrobiales bacterium]
MADKFERLTNLVALLLDTSRPLTREEILDRLDSQYEGTPEARRTTFERDKALLREEGVPVEVEGLEGGASGYRIRPDALFLPDLGLAPDELVALHVAVAAVRVEGGWGKEALWKLGEVEGTAPPPLASLPAADALPALYRARLERAPVTFGYRGERRTVDPWGLLCRSGFWYVVGFDHARGASRTFRVDRIDRGAVSVGEPGTTSPPEGFDVRQALPADPRLIGDGEVVDALVLVDGVVAPRVVLELGDDRVVERRADGSVLVQVAVANRAAFRSWVLGLLDRAEVIGPPALRDDLVDWLERLAAGAGAAR